MQDSGAREISKRRVAAMSGALLVAAAGLCVLVRALPATGWGNALALLAGLCLTPMLASPFEWWVHRYVYHRRLVPGLARIYAIHHHSHHHVFFPTWRYVTAGPARRIPILGGDTETVSAGGLGNALTRSAHFVFYMLLGLVLIVTPAWLATGHRVFLAGVLAALVVVSNLFITVHDTIHRPGSHKLLEAQPWFRFLDNHHYIHHVDTEANVNFLLPLADWLFGTLRRSLTAAELRLHGSRQEAKALPVGIGEPARAAAHDLRHRPAV
ncbi:MAG TPA: hypothetical protein VII13_04415 [Vicinamibacteria bacterium]|jgi:hypothetical protein